MIAGPRATLQRLRRFAAVTRNDEPTPRQAERCELCAAPLAEPHPHLLELAGRRLRCACQACAILFDGSGGPGPGAGPGPRFWRVPTQVRRWPDGDRVAAEVWGRLDIPVQLAFLVAREAEGETPGGGAAVYPGAAGCVETPIAAGRWAELCGAITGLDRLAPEVEALLMDRRGPAVRALRVPIDECYRLAGHLRRGWRGLSGGLDLAAEVGALLTELERRALPAATEAACPA